uniref:NADP-dependent oxidoreductase domain-containing protein n=1 Tax=Salmo trutta TaxID=8032 RepID=A0A673ZG79_SALTR
MMMMSSSLPSFRLNAGSDAPPGPTAIGAGNHAFDTPTVYGNEAYLGRALLDLMPKHKLTRGDLCTVMEELHANEMLRAIGVSNYSLRHLTELLETCRVNPAVLQFHPRLAQRERRTICRHSVVCFQAYTSLGKCTLLSNHKLWLWRRGMKMDKCLTLTWMERLSDMDSGTSFCNRDPTSVV